MAPPAPASPDPVVSDAAMPGHAMPDDAVPDDVMPGPLAAEDTRPNPAAGESALRILVVDDNPHIRHLITVNLELEGMEVVTAVDGQDAVERVESVAPDVVTMDVVMPRLDGFAAAAKIKSNPATAHLPVLMVTAAVQEADLRRGRQIGVDAYLTKPFDPAELVTLVRSLAAGERPEQNRLVVEG